MMLKKIREKRKNKRGIKLYVFFLLMCFFVNPCSFALNVVVPAAWGEKDLNINYTHVTWWENTTMELIQMINEYLWFFVWLVAFLLVAYSGFKIITAQGEKEQISKSYDLLIGSVVVIFISLLSYTLVRLVVNLF